MKSVIIAGLTLCLGPASAIAAKPTLRVLVYGDAGNGGPEQYAVAKAMFARHSEKSFDFAVSTGDNQYITGTGDEVMKKVFADPYAQLIQAGLKFYQTIGNHDLEDGRLPNHFAYSQKINAEELGTGGWVLPSENYVIQKPDLDWIVANVTTANNEINISEQTIAFLSTELCKVTTSWKVLSIHYPLWSSGKRGDNKALQAVLLPIIDRCKPDMIFAGHEHVGDVALPYQWTHLFTSGNAHQVHVERSETTQPSLFHASELGFAELELLPNNAANVRFFSVDSRLLYTTQIQKRPTIWGDVFESKGDSVIGRAKFLNPSSLPTDTLEAELGVSPTAYTSPLEDLGDWTFLQAEVFNEEWGLKLFKATMPADFKSGYAIYRFRKQGTTEWTYGDRSGDYGLHGNYDGIRKEHLLKIERPAPVENTSGQNIQQY